jgi:hypothetical protein
MADERVEQILIRLIDVTESRLAKVAVSRHVSFGSEPGNDRVCCSDFDEPPFCRARLMMCFELRYAAKLNLLCIATTDLDEPAWRDAVRPVEYFVATRGACSGKSISAKSSDSISRRRSRFTFALAAYNLIRLPRLLAAPA